jgi:hypothetical protein
MPHDENLVLLRRPGGLSVFRNGYGSEVRAIRSCSPLVAIRGLFERVRAVRHAVRHGLSLPHTGGTQ